MQAIMPEFMRTNDLPHILIQRLVENDIVLTAIGQIIALQVAKIMVLDFDTKLFGQGIGPARMIPVPQYLNLFQDKMHSDHPNMYATAPRFKGNRDYSADRSSVSFDRPPFQD